MEILRKKKNIKTENGIKSVEKVYVNIESIKEYIDILKRKIDSLDDGIYDEYTVGLKMCYEELYNKFYFIGE